MEKGAIYARFSSHGQREESIEGQLRVCHEYAKRNNIEIVKEYADRAISGKTDQREAFQHMLKDSDSHKFQTLICYAVDRFARNVYQDAINKSRLAKNGVHVVYACQPISDDPEGKLMENILVGMAEYYSDNLARGVKRGMYENATKGKSNGGTVPLGFKIENSYFVIDEETAPTVRYIFDRYTSGTGITEIVRDLERKGFRTPKGKPLTYHGVYGILKNKRYIGQYKFEDVVIENAWEPIVSQETFEKAQQIREQNRTVKKKRVQIPLEDRYILTGKLFCGKCKSAMVGTSGKGKSGKIYRYYMCSNKDRKNINKKKIEDIVIEHLTDRFFTEQIIKEMARLVVEYNADQTKTKETINELIKQKKRLEGEKQNIINAIVKGMDASLFVEKSEDIKAQLEYINEQIDNISSAPQITEEQAEFFLIRMFENSWSDDPEYRQRLVDTLIKKIYLYEDRIEIIFNLPSGLDQSDADTLEISDDIIIKCSDKFKCGSPLLNHTNTYIIIGISFVALQIYL